VYFYTLKNKNRIQRYSVRTGWSLDMSSDKELRIKAKEKAEKKIGFYSHLGIYIVVNLFLVGIWWFTGGFGTFPWFIFPLFGWGIAIVANYISAFKGTDYVDKMTEKEYERLKKQEQ
jgi:hypothetical protein